MIHIHKERINKGKLLSLGLARTNCELICIFDADAAPPPDFLHGLIPSFLSDERIGVVQSSLDFLNYNANLLTRAQGLWGDYRYSIENSVSDHFHRPVYSTGSGVMFRRNCIEDVGGWQAYTSSEDLDISLRIQEKGWKFAYAQDVKIGSELPEYISSLKRQQNRWAFSAVQIICRKESSIIKGAKKTVTVANYLGGYVSAMAVLAVVLFTLPMSVLGMNPASPWVWPLFIVACNFVICFIALRRSYPADWPNRLLYSPALVFLTIGLSMCLIAGAVQGLSNNSQPPLRTPKSTPKGKEYEVAPYPLWFRFLETLPVSYLLIALFFAIRNQSDLIPVIVFLLLGFVFILYFEVSSWILERRNVLL